MRMSGLFPSDFLSLDYIVLIPLQKTATINIVAIERRNQVNTNDSNILHIGGGSNGDLIIYKNPSAGKFNPSHFSHSSSILLQRIERKSARGFFYPISSHSHGQTNEQGSTRKSDSIFLVCQCETKSTD